jgi:hypothetical protein
MRDFRFGDVVEWPIGGKDKVIRWFIIDGSHMGGYTAFCVHVDDHIGTKAGDIDTIGPTGDADEVLLNE